MKRLPAIALLLLLVAVLQGFAQNNVQAEKPLCKEKSGLTNLEIDELLAEHNRVRSEIKVAALKWDCDLAAAAQEWADAGIYTHDTADEYNENMYASSAQDVKPSTAVGRWYSEIAFYDQNKKACTPGKMCSHYFHIISKKAKNVGCGMIRRNIGKNRNAFLVCYYSPGLKQGELPF